MRTRRNTCAICNAFACHLGVMLQDFITTMLRRYLNLLQHLRCCTIMIHGKVLYRKIHRQFKYICITHLVFIALPDQHLFISKALWVVGLCFQKAYFSTNKVSFVLKGIVQQLQHECCAVPSLHFYVPTPIVGYNDCLLIDIMISVSIWWLMCQQVILTYCCLVYDLYSWKPTSSLVIFGCTLSKRMVFATEMGVIFIDPLCGFLSFVVLVLASSSHLLQYGFYDLLHT